MGQSEGLNGSLVALRSPIFCSRGCSKFCGLPQNFSLQLCSQNIV